MLIKGAIVNAGIINEIKALMQKTNKVKITIKRSVQIYMKG